MSGTTIFDRMLAGEIPYQKVYEDEWVLAFNDINPVAKVHVLVIPKKKIIGFNQVQESETIDMGEYMKSIAKVAEHCNLKESGYRVVFNSGSHGQQTVQYIHAHIIGGQQLNWPPC